MKGGVSPLKKFQENFREKSGCGIYKDETEEQNGFDF